MSIEKSAPAITEASVVAATKDQVSADLEDEAVVLHLESGVYFGLDPVGARIWALIQEPRSVGAVKEALLEEFEVAPDRCERDLLAFLRELAAHALVEVSDGESA